MCQADRLGRVDLFGWTWFRISVSPNGFLWHVLWALCGTFCGRSSAISVLSLWCPGVREKSKKLENGN